MFSKRKIEHIPDYEGALFGFEFRHWLSCMFIRFEDENKFPKIEGWHEINRDEFIAKMIEWNVEITGLTDNTVKQ